MKTGLKKRITCLANRFLAFSLKDLYVVRGEAGYPVIGPPLGQKVEEYFQARQNDRRWLIKDFEDNFNLSSVNFCSVGCGYGGEEWLLKNKVKQLVLIEPDPEACDFMKGKFPENNVSIFQGPMQSYQAQEKYDVIYTSGPSNWMHASPWIGIPNGFIDFLKTYLADQGVFVAKLYGGHFPEIVVGSPYFITILCRKLAENGFKIIYYKWADSQALLIASRTGANWNSSNLKFSDQGMVIVKDGTIIKKRKLGLRRLKIAFRLMLYVPIKISRGLVKTIYSTMNDVLINMRI